MGWTSPSYPACANPTLGIASADDNLIALFELYYASRWQFLWNLRPPVALPQMPVGLRIAGGYH